MAGNSYAGNGTSNELKTIYFGDQSSIHNPLYRNLPSAYKQVEYIESTGIETIDTDVRINQGNISITADFQVTEYNAQNRFFIFGINDSNAGIAVSVANSAFESIGSAVFSQTSDIYARTEVTVDQLSGSPVQLRTIELFSASGYGLIRGKVRLYSAKIYSYSNLIRDFVPCIRKSDNMPGLYDLVDELFYQSDTVIPSGYERIEFIEGTGTQYINTGVYVTQNNLAIEVKCAALSNDYSGNNSAFIIGCYASSSKRFGACILRSSDSNKKKLRMFLGGGYWTDSTAMDTDIHKLIINMGTKQVIKDGVAKAKTSGTYSQWTDENAWIGIFNGYIEGDISDNNFIGRVYNVQIWDSNMESVFHDYQPVMRMSDHVPGMYDTIGKGFYPSVTGEDFYVGNYRQKYFITGRVIYPSTAHTIRRTYIGDPNGIARQIFPKTYLPVGYQQVEYIESTGEQYINTGIYMTTNQISGEIKAEYTAWRSSGDGYLFGAYSGSKRFCVIYKESTHYPQIGIGGGYWRNGAAYALNTVHTYKVDMKNLKAYVDGANKNSTSGSYSRYTDSNLSIGIFCHDDGGSKVSAKVYYVKIWISDVLAHDYYPCYRISDHEPGLYDIVTDTFLSNAGTGEFELGPKHEELL